MRIHQPERPDTGEVTVVGIGADGWNGLSAEARTAVAGADVLFGSERQLDLAPDTVHARKIAWPSPLLDRLEQVLGEHANKRVCVLASGDPLLSGIGSTLVRRLGAGAVRIVPAESSVTLARARLGWSFEETEVISSVARSVHRVSRALGPGKRILVLSSGAETPGEIAEVLRARGYGASTLTVLENLGAEEESHCTGSAGDWLHPECQALNVVAIHCVADAGTPPLATVAGLPDEAFEHDGQLTKRDLRASALARLSPLAGQLLWDIGAGAGSVAIEWCRAHPSNRAVAVERDTARATRIEGNTRRLGVPDVRVIVGTAPDALPDDEQPDAIFLGGGVSTPGMVRSCLAALVPGGRLVAHGVTVESESTLASARAEHGGELTRIAVEHAAPLGDLTGWQPARTVTQLSITKHDEPEAPAVGGEYR